MSEARNLRWLWRSVDDSLRLHRNIGVASLSKEKEREILLALSLVFRKAQLMSKELDSVSDDVDGLETRMDCESEIRSNSEELHCLSKITLDLVCLMMINSQFIQHLAGNVLVVVSEFVAESGKNWKAFMRFLCVSVDSAIISSSENGDEDSDRIVSSFVSALRDRLKTADWSIASGMVRVFRCILKNSVTNHDDDGDWLMSVYCDSVYSCLSNVPWDSFDKLFGARNDSSERFTFMGNVIQLLCSFADHSDAVEDFSFVISLIPKILIWCPQKQEGSQYFRHKILVLMMRISYRTSLDCSVLVSWLQLLLQHFGELLRRPITSLELAQNDSLEGSPFLASFHGDEEEANGLSSLHVHRRAVFIFLRCCLGLMISTIGTPLKCACVESECCGKKRSLMELKNWIQWQLSADFLVDSENYLPKCVNFSLAFLRLYIHEDDLLFKMLLQLLCLPITRNEEFKKDDVLFHVSNLLNHVHMFHLFLAELHYDHQVLLDYLISKDTGTSCAEYLLRSLRAVCDSWHLFLEFSVDGKRTNKSSLEKRSRISFVGDKALTDQSRPLEKKAYREAKDCLLSLLASVESLEQKKLFPYNPKVLLKRLRAFQELC